MAVALSAAVLLLCLQAYAETRVAVLGSQAAGVEKLVPLVELRLGQKKEITLLERENIKEIFREQELQALMTAEGTAKRIALGKLLKADLLVILQGQAKPQPHARVTICETKQGLRLCNQPVELSKNIENDADAVVRAIDTALQRQRTPLKDIVAVPPFVNSTLVFEGDYLKASCAELIEELLADQPGVRVVELAEAQAIAKELALLGDSNVQRRLPLYLMGEYRLENSGGRKDASFTLTLLRGTSQIDQQREEAVSLDAFPGRIRDAASAMFSKALGQAVKPPDPVTEAKQLADRAQLSARLGLWEEAMSLAEASLLVKPDQWDLHREAAFYMDQIIEERRSKAGFYGNGPKNCDAATREIALAFLPRYLVHLETCLMNEHTDPRQRDPRQRTARSPRFGIIELLVGLMQNARSEEEFNSVKASFEPVMAMARRVARCDLTARNQNPTLLFGCWHPPMLVPLGEWQRRQNRRNLQEIRADGMRLIDELTYLRHPMSVRDLLLKMQVDRLSGANQFALYRKLAQLPYAREEAELWLKSSCSGAHFYMNTQGEGPGRRHLPVPWDNKYYPERPREKVEDVSFHPIPLNEHILNFLPLGPGMDLVVASQGFYLMKQKGELRRLNLPSPARAAWAPEGLIHPPEPQFLANVCFDGRYVWIAVCDPDGFLAVVDPETERIEKITAVDHLPPMKIGSLAPLAPGKICAAGYFGRTWCAIATFDPQKGKSFKVFFEAREVSDKRMYDANNTHIAFQVGPMRTLTAPAGAAKPGEQRVYLDGGHALLIDPQKCVVEKVAPYADCRSLFCVHEGAIYWRQAGGPGPVWRFGFPDFKEETVHDHIQFGPAVVYQGRIWMFAECLCFAKNFKDRFTPLRHNLPNRKAFYWDFSPVVSNHYGLLVLGKGQAYQVELHKPMPAVDAATDARPAAEPPPDAVAVAAEIEKLGGCVTRDETAASRPVIAIDLYTNIDAPQIAKLRALSELQSLGARSNEYTGKGLAQLKGLSKLHSLCVGLRTINDDTMKELVELKQLRSLELVCEGRVSAAALAKLKELPDLRALILVLPRCDDPQASYLAGLDHLESLTLWQTPIGRTGLARLKDLPHIRRLEMVFNKVKDADLAGLKDAASLENLDLRWLDIGDGGLNFLKGLNRLQTLTLMRTEITDAGLVQLARLERLQSLDLSGAAVGDSGLDRLRPLASLESLNLSNTKITDDGLQQLASLPRLRELELAGTEISDAGVVKLRACSRLQALNLDHTAVEGSGLRALSALPELQTLHLQGTRILDSETAILVEFPQLRTLYLDSCRLLSAASVPHIVRIPRLEALDIDNAGFLQNEWGAIKQARPDLDELHHGWDGWSRVKGRR